MNLPEYQAMFAVEDTHWWYVGLRHQIVTALRRWTAQRPAGAPPVKVLDAGCGTGGLLAHLSQVNRQVNHRWLVAPARGGGTTARWLAGIDLEREGLRLSRSRGLPNLLQGSVALLPVKSNAFDAVISIDVLCSIGVDEAAAFRELHRILKPGGLVILQVPAFEWLRSEHDVAVSTKRRYTCHEVNRLAEHTGFMVRQSQYRNVLLFPVIAVLRLLKRHRAHAEHARSDVKPVPRFLNAILTRVLIFESHLLQRVRVPFGLSVFCIGQKKMS